MNTSRMMTVMRTDLKQLIGARDFWIPMVLLGGFFFFVVPAFLLSIINNLGSNEAVQQVFQCLDMMEEVLAERRYLAGDRVTEADWRAFPTLLRFDLVYYSHFKCNLRRVQDYPNVANYLRELYQWPGIKDTLDLGKIKAGYYGQLNINPAGIVPVGPTLDHLGWSHDRGRLPATWYTGRRWNRCCSSHPATKRPRWEHRWKRR